MGGATIPTARSADNMQGRRHGGTVRPKFEVGERTVHGYIPPIFFKHIRKRGNVQRFVKEFGKRGKIQTKKGHEKFVTGVKFKILV